MPFTRRSRYVKKTRKPGRAKRRYQRKSFAGGKARRMVNPMRGPAPDRYYCKLKYSEGFSLSSTSSFASEIYQSSCYDPAHAAGGHQPRGWDQLTALWSRYRVYGMSFRLQGCNVNASPMYVIAKWKNVDSVDSSINDTFESTYSKGVRLIGSTSSNNSVFTMKGYASVSRILGVKKIQVRTEDDFAANTGSNPNRMVYLHIYQIAQDGSTSLTNNYNIDITYYVELSTRVNLTQS